MIMAEGTTTIQMQTNKQTNKQTNSILQGIGLLPLTVLKQLKLVSDSQALQCFMLVIIC